MENMIKIEGGKIDKEGAKNLTDNITELFITGSGAEVSQETIQCGIKALVKVVIATSEVKNTNISNCSLVNNPGDA